MSAKILATTEHMPYEEWLEYRKQGIGGSDASVVCGINRYKAPIELWMEKTDQMTHQEAGEAAYWGNILESVRHADLVMCDLKDADEERHLRLTGARIEIIRENIRRVSSELGKPVLLRTPIIPGVNADVETISQIAAFAATLPTLVAYELLPYHPLGVDKARALGTEAIRYEKPSLDLIHTLANAAGKQVNRVRVAGILR